VAELREDSITGNRVIVAPARSTRPHTVADHGATRPTSTDNCPFCEGHEHETPPEVARTGGGAPETPGWRVRVVPNKYPIVGEGVAGAHEVVILSPQHDGTLAHLPAEHARAVLCVVRDRAAYHLDNGCAYVSMFVNQGKAAGASIAHPHAQLVALDEVPPAVDRALDRFRAEGDLVATQIAAVEDSPFAVDGFAASVWCPPASTSAYAVRFALREGGARFDRATDDDIVVVTDALQGVLRRLAAVIGDDAPYNVVVNSAPRDDDRPYHWWIDVFPRVSVAAGFEYATGLSVCSIAPEDAARALRDAS
jgi:UDPglucose--hexose-1-phosphate uridylyltransferase